MKYYIISGEASGDIHGANLIKELQKLDSSTNCRFWGGDNMQSITNQKAVKHINDLAFMGFAEVLFNLKTILNNISFCKQDILEFKPNVLILIDYPGFNLRIAEFASKHNIKVVYYISPQIWAWKENRIKKIKKYVNQMLVILPFEKGFYAKHNMKVEYVGHPLLDHISDQHNDISANTESNSPVIAILPGSRKQEISRMLPIMASLFNAPFLNNYQFVICGVGAFSKSFYQSFINQPLSDYSNSTSTKNNISISYSNTHEILSTAHLAVVTSGTATLETALFNVPEVVCYKANKLSYLIAKQLIKLKYISLVNLIMDKEVVTELIQKELNEKKLLTEVKKLTDNTERQKMLQEYQNLNIKLGGKGASKRAANLIYNALVA